MPAGCKAGQVTGTKSSPTWRSPTTRPPPHLSSTPAPTSARWSTRQCSSYAETVKPFAAASANNENCAATQRTPSEDRTERVSRVLLAWQGDASCLLSAGAVAPLPFDATGKTSATAPRSGSHDAPTASTALQTRTNSSQVGFRDVQRQLRLELAPGPFKRDERVPGGGAQLRPELNQVLHLQAAVAQQPDHVPVAEMELHRLIIIWPFKSVHAEVRLQQPLAGRPAIAPGTPLPPVRPVGTSWRESRPHCGVCVTAG
jgi:hypothetical protein